MRANNQILRSMLLMVLLGTALLPFSATAQGRSEPLALSETTITGPQPFITVLCRFADSTGPATAPSDFEALFSPVYPGLDNYWREVSYNRISLSGSRIAGWYTLSEPFSTYETPATPGVDLGRLAADCASAATPDVDFLRYAGINLVLDHDARISPRGGQMYLSLNGERKRYGVTWFWGNAARDQAAWAHEMGHAFGLAHSLAGQNEEYGNVWDMMSQDGPCFSDPVYGPVAQHMIAFDKDRLGWIAPERKFLVPEHSESTIMLEQLAQPGPGGYLMAQIPIDGSSSHFYTVEARRRSGYDAHLPGDAVLIHEADTERALPAHLVSRFANEQATAFAGMWTVGTRFLDREHGIVVAIDAETASGYAVTISTHLSPGEAVSFGQAKQAEPTALAAGLVAAASKIPAGAALAAGPQEDLYAAWSAEDAGIPTIRVSHRTGGTWETLAPIRPEARGTPAIDPGIAVSAQGDIYVVWVGGRPASTGAPESSDIWFAYVGAGGEWSKPVRVNDNAGPALLADPAIAIDATGRAYAVWSDTRNGAAHVYSAAWAADGGWGANVRVDHATGEMPGQTFSPAVATNGIDNTWAAWAESRPGQVDVYSAYRPAGGAWGASVRVSQPEPGYRTGPALAIDSEGNVHAAWESYRAGGALSGAVGEIEAAVRPAGQDWGPVVRVAAGIGSRQPARPGLLTTPAGPYLIWQEAGESGAASFSAYRWSGDAWQRELRAGI
jgi:M6 family metalloprotease-like protein